jgi:hypothetical protein
MIVYHGTPCGGKRSEVAEFLQSGGGRQALVPFYRPEDLPIVAEVCRSFCLDNGAYSAWQAGTPIKDWREYYTWANEWLQHPGCDFCIIPDVIDGSEDDNNALIAQWHQKSGRRGKPGAAPVWHLHESLKRLDWLCYFYERVCLGSSGEYATPNTDRWWDRMAEAMTTCCDDKGRPKTKLHGLRMADPAIYHRLPLSSADSTNAVRNANDLRRFGMYPPPTRAQRMEVIANRMEAHNSAAVWVSRAEQRCLILV